MKVGAGVIGLRFGLAHAMAYQSHPEVVLQGVCDVDPQQLHQGAAQLANVEFTTTDYRELLARDDIGVVSVATPDFLHAEMSIAALRAGKHVLCEKPMTTTVEEALAVAEAARECGRRFMVGQVCRFAPGFALAKQIVDSGEIGRLFFVESEYAHNYTAVPGRGGWRKDARRPRNAFLGGGCHAVDLLRWVSGEMVEVSAYSNHLALPDWPVDDCVVAIFKFENGAVGKVFCSIGCVRPYTMRSVFYGTDGTVICDNTSDSIQLCSRHRSQGRAVSFEPLVVPLASHNIDSEVALFVDCVLNDRPVPTDALEGARTVAACLAATKSAETGQPVVLSRI